MIWLEDLYDDDERQRELDREAEQLSRRIIGDGDPPVRPGDDDRIVDVTEHAHEPFDIRAHEDEGLALADLEAARFTRH